MFLKLDEKAVPLTQELYDLMKARESSLIKNKPNADQFWQHSSVSRWSGLVTKSKKKAGEEKKEIFLKEWFETLQIIRDLSERVSSDEYRPSWMPDNTPQGVQVDQFLHAYYYEKVRKPKGAGFDALHAHNRLNVEGAVEEQLIWWRNIEAADVVYELEMIKTKAPFIQNVLRKQQIANMSQQDFMTLCSYVHAIREYARRVQNKTLGLPSSQGAYSMDTKVPCLAEVIWTDRSDGGYDVKQVLEYVMYGGSSEDVPKRLWQAVFENKYKIKCLGLSSFGELVGWAMPDVYPPRNGRTSKALRALGNDVRVHVGT